MDSTVTCSVQPINEGMVRHLVSSTTHRLQKMGGKLLKKLVLVLLAQVERLSQFLAEAVEDTAAIKAALICAACAVCTFVSSLSVRTCHSVVKGKSTFRLFIAFHSMWLN